MANRATPGQQFVGAVPKTSLDLGGFAKVAGVSMPPAVWDWVRKTSAQRGLSTSRLVTLLILEHCAATEKAERLQQRSAAAGVDEDSGGRVLEG